MMYVSQVIMLYTLNLYSAVCQLYLNKTGGEKCVQFTIKNIYIIKLVKLIRKRGNKKYQHEKQIQML